MSAIGVKQTSQFILAPRLPVKPAFCRRADCSVTLVSNDQIFDHCFATAGRDVMVSGFLFNAEVILFSAIPLHAIG